MPEINCSYNSCTYRNFSFSKILYPNPGRKEGAWTGARGEDGTAETDTAGNSAIVSAFRPVHTSPLTTAIADTTTTTAVLASSLDLSCKHLPGCVVVTARRAALH